eukprot:2745214-Amphidinium_carterae.1
MGLQIELPLGWHPQVLRPSMRLIPPRSRHGRQPPERVLVPWFPCRYYPMERQAPGPIPVRG